MLNTTGNLEDEVGDTQPSPDERSTKYRQGEIIVQSEI